MEQKQIARLVEKMKKGDKDAFNILYQETSKTIYFLCISFLNNEEDARDVMQDTYITAYQKLEQLQDEEKFTAWISQIAVNKCKKLLLKNSPVLLEPESMTELATENNESFLPEEYITQKSKRKIVMDIMRKKLSDIQYQTVILFYFNDLSIEEIADIMECPPGTVKYRLSVSRAKIKEGVLEYENESRDKLYSFTPIPFLAGLLTAEASNMEVPDVWGNIQQELEMLSGTIGGFTKEVTKKMIVGTMKGSGVVMKTMKMKIIITLLCVVLVGGGLTAVIITMANKSAEEKEMQDFIALMEEIESEKKKEVKEDISEKRPEESGSSYKNSEKAEKTENAEDTEILTEGLSLEFESLKGKVEQMNCYLGTNVLLLSDNKLYYREKEVLNLENGVKDFWAYTSIEFGDMIAVVDVESKLSIWEGGKMYIDFEPKLVFEGLPFDASKEFILDASSGSVDILCLEGGSAASITTYHINKDKTLSFAKTTPIEKFEDWSVEENDFLEIPVKELIALSNPDKMGGYSIFGITDNNDLYQITQFGKNCEMEYIVGGVERAYCDYSVIYSTDPVYSLIGETNKLYSKVKGNSMLDSSDDTELTFVLPEGHTTDEIVNVFGDIDMLCVFEFNNGDIYYIDETIDEKNGGEYAMVKCEELSKLKEQRQILEIGMPSTGVAKVYVLLDDSSIYSIDF